MLEIICDVFHWTHKNNVKVNSLKSCLYEVFKGTDTIHSTQSKKQSKKYSTQSKRYST